ncbi:MAG: excinuclease ABC subunit UvrA [Tannerellaceae bacterium]|jgi:excinuclease ABC subunit A|nr:excinuclease ABC subunit UvrA [Tannerellaceae bacterium]
MDDIHTPHKGFICAKGIRVNNLKGIDVEIPRNRLVVLTGLSGSGKSSLAFDTLYAEGQRRYVESLSAYARQFMGRIGKPDCDYITGLPPAIAVEQKVNTRNPRSTVGTSTEIYEYLRLLFAHIGKIISPVSGQEVKQHRMSDLTRWLFACPSGMRFDVSAPIELPPGREMREQLDLFHKEGYTRLLVCNEVQRIRQVLQENRLPPSSSDVELLIDRLEISHDHLLQSRLADSAETAFYEGRGVCRIRVYMPEGVRMKTFSKKLEADGIVFEEPTDLMFSFNNPIGACPVCEGFGKITGIDEDLVVPNKTLSVYQGAVACWNGEVMGEWLTEFIHKSNRYDFPIHRPYQALTEKEKQLLWDGARGLPGIRDFFRFISENLYKVQYRVLQARYRGKSLCPACHGSRLKPQALYVQVGGKTIAALVALPVAQLKTFLDHLTLDDTDTEIARRIRLEISSRLQFLLDVGLGYLTLDRLSCTLSGGESQRINLATSLGSSLVGSLYILDEPSIGLHSRDTHRLIRVLYQLRDLGNTVIVVEHDEDIIRAADYIIDIGPQAGRLGGEVVYQGDMADLQKHTGSYTVRFLTGEDRISPPPVRRKWNNYIEVKEARKNNLKGINVRFPLNVMTVVSGVSGSGKSTLVREVFYEGVRRALEQVADGATPEGDLALIHGIEFVDQHSIGRSTRSNPVTYIGAYDEIRKLFSEQPLARRMGFTPSFFSFNVEGGRCEECKGEGHLTVEMQFMADLSITCDVCHGKRFRTDVLEVEYRGVSIYGLLEMTVDQAIAFFAADPAGSMEKRIVKKLLPLREVGLGYIRLGQSSSTLSGGENQRVKLAYYLAKEKQRSTFFVFDEPTTGLHFHDIKTLLKAFNALIARGHSVLVIEHNLEVIRCADHVIDLGPEGGDLGGELLCAGTPEDIAQCPASYTGRFLKNKLKMNK